MLPIRFYDMPGIGEENSVRQNELDMILNGEVKRGLEVNIKVSSFGSIILNSFCV